MLQAVVFLVYCRFKTEEMFKKTLLYPVKTISELFPFSLAFCSKSAIFFAFYFTKFEKEFQCVVVNVFLFIFIAS